MDEYIVPNCPALMEPARKFSMILENAPSHASRLACEHDKTVLHGTVEFPTSVLSRPRSLRLLSMERAQSAARPVSCSGQSRWIAGTFLVESALGCSRKLA